MSKWTIKHHGEIIAKIHDDAIIICGNHVEVRRDEDDLRSMNVAVSGDLVKHGVAINSYITKDRMGCAVASAPLHGPFIDPAVHADRILT